MQHEIFITSVIVQARPSAISAVCAKLATHKEVEIAHSEIKTGKIIVIIESQSLAAIQHLIDRINTINGVVSTTMVYQHGETACALEEVLA